MRKTRLVLHLETLRALHLEDLDQVRGGDEPANLHPEDPPPSGNIFCKLFSKGLSC